MVIARFDYATPSAFSSTRDREELGFTANRARQVRLHATVKPSARLAFRYALRALGELIWADDSWVSRGEYVSAILDPVITVHEDRVFFEAFSQDQSSYGLVIVDRSVLETEGEVVLGTTNIDFSAWLWAALGEMRSRRTTWLRIETNGFEVETQRSGGRWEAKVELPDDWVRGFLQLQSAMMIPGTRLRLRPVDLLSALRHLRHQKAKVSPRALRYEFDPGEPARLVLEPWETVIPLKGTEHNYEVPRVIRTWGRRRLRLIEPLLPYAQSVDVYFKGRARPSFYSVALPGVRFVLGLSGFTGQAWTSSGGFDLAVSSRTDEVVFERIARLLETHGHLGVEGVARLAEVSNEIAARSLMRLCRLGRAIYDIEARELRSRALFAEPIDEASFYPPEPRLEKAQALLAESKVSVEQVGLRETRKQRRLKTPDGPVLRELILRDWEVKGSAGEEPRVEIVIDDRGQIIFGVCGCRFFQENLMNQGPCEHMIALFSASEDRHQDGPSSRPGVEQAKDEDELESEEES